MTKVHRIVLLVVDHEGLGAGSMKSLIEDTPNDYVMPSVMQIDTREIEWHDAHRLNSSETVHAAFEELFSELTKGSKATC